MPPIKKVLHCAQVKATAGRNIRVVSSDGGLDLNVIAPRELRGASGRGTNPEQLFAASYAASFLGMMRLVAAREGIGFSTDTEVELRICLPGLPRAEADVLVEQSHAARPYSNATRDNVSVRLVFA
jgi:osmotically inducible protein OsmC